MNFHLAQVNVAIAKYSYEDPRFSGFVDELDRINALADRSPGFIWRYVAEDETSAGTEAFGEETLLFNMSVWESKQALMDFVYKTDHVNILRKRAEWFVPQNRPVMAVWWLAAGTVPTIAESKRRLEILEQAGPSEDAFTFRHFFASPEAESISGG